MKYLLLAALALSACAKDPNAPNERSFISGDEHIEIKGELLPGAKISVEEAKASVDLAVHLLSEKK